MLEKGKLIKMNDENMSVEQAIRSVKVNGANLFLGIEQGSDKHVNDVQVATKNMRKKRSNKLDCS